MRSGRIRRFVGNRAGLTWLLLIAATVTSWVLGVEHGTGALTAVVVLAIALAKVRLVGLDFMELRGAPVALRAAFEGYCLALWGVLAGLYLWL